MNTARSTYQVHAEIRGTATTFSALDDEKAGHPLERRLNRIERAAATFRGKIDERSGTGLKIAFETADAALLGACEMQHRCSVLPQASGNRLVLRIGIHQGVAHQRSRDGVDNTRKIASQLAVADDGIVTSGVVVAALNLELRKLARPLSTLPPELAAHKIEWRSEIPSAIHGGESIWPASRPAYSASPRLVLHYGLQTFELTHDNPVLTIGRDAQNTLALPGNHISRNHCRIERQINGIVLIDSSTNGTCVTRDEDVKLMIKNNSVVLRGKGMLFFGRTADGERRGGVSYEVH